MGHWHTHEGSYKICQGRLQIRLSYSRLSPREQNSHKAISTFHTHRASSALVNYRIRHHKYLSLPSPFGWPCVRYRGHDHRVREESRHQDIPNTHQDPPTVGFLTTAFVH